MLLHTTKRRDVLFAPWGKGQNDLVEDTQKYLGQVGKKKSVTIDMNSGDTSFKDFEYF